MKKLFSYICIFSLIFSIAASNASAQDAQKFKSIDRSRISEMLPKECAGGTLKGKPMALRYQSDGGLVNEASGKYAGNDGEIVFRLSAKHSTVATDEWNAARKALAGESSGNSGKETIELKMIGKYPAKIILNQSAKIAVVNIALENGIVLTAQVSNCDNSQAAIETCSTLDLDGWNSLK